MKKTWKMGTAEKISSRFVSDSLMDAVPYVLFHRARSPRRGLCPIKMIAAKSSSTKR